MRPIIIKSLFFFFFFFLLVFPVSGATSQIDLIPNVHLDYVTGAIQMNLSDYFDGYSYANVYLNFLGYYDMITSSSYGYCSNFSENCAASSQIFWLDYMNLTLYDGGGGDVFLEFSKIGTNNWEFEVYPVQIEVWDASETSWSWQYIHFISSNTSVYYDPEPGVQPSVIGSISDADLYADDVTLYMNDYFVNYDWIIASWGDPVNGRAYSLSKRAVSTIEECVPDLNQGPANNGIMVCAVGTGGEVIFYITGYRPEVATFNISFVAYNIYGSSDGESAQYTTANVTPVYYEPPSYEQNASESFSFIGYLTYLFSEIYPDKSHLSFRQEMGYVLITALIVNLVGLFLFIGTKSTQYAGLILLVLNTLMVFYFLAIGYIPIAVLVILGLILLGLPLIKSRVIGS